MEKLFWFNFEFFKFSVNTTCIRIGSWEYPHKCKITQKVLKGGRIASLF